VGSLENKELIKFSMRFILTLFLCLSFSNLIHTQSAYPNKPLRLVVDSVPGGTTDLLARIAADGLTQQFGMAVVVDNKAGATGNLAMDYVMKSSPDGYTLLICANGNLLIKPFLETGSNFNPLTDVLPVFNTAELPHLIVIPSSLAIKDMSAFIAYGKANPGKIFYGSAGIGSQPHISGSQFSRLSDIKSEHIPYKGMGSAMTDILAGRIQFMSAAFGTVRGYVKSGDLKPLAVGSKKRISALPDVPTSAEVGLPNWEMSAWFGVFAPKGTQAEVSKILNDRLQIVFDDPKVKLKMVEIGAEPVGGSINSFAERIKSDYKMYGQVIKESGISFN
jgi:tripartite-type tricarboxylate transporter receptor subunit TctC